MVAARLVLDLPVVGEAVIVAGPPLVEEAGRLTPRASAGGPRGRAALVPSVQGLAGIVVSSHPGAGTGAPQAQRGRQLEQSGTAGLQGSTRPTILALR